MKLLKLRDRPLVKKNFVFYLPTDMTFIDSVAVETLDSCSHDNLKIKENKSLEIQRGERKEMKYIPGVGEGFW